MSLSVSAALFISLCVCMYWASVLESACIDLWEPIDEFSGIVQTDIKTNY